MMKLATQNGHSGEGRNPGGAGMGNVARSKTTRGEGFVARDRLSIDRFQATLYAANLIRSVK